MVQSCCSILSHDPLHHGLSSNSLETGKRGLFGYCRSRTNTSAVLLREHAYSATGNYLKSGSFEIWLHHPGNCIPGGHCFYMQFTRPLLFLLKWVWLTRLNVHLGFLGTQMWLKSRDEQRRPASRRFVHRAPTFSTAETYTMLNAFDMQVSTQVSTKTGIVLQYTDSACLHDRMVKISQLLVSSWKRAHFLAQGQSLPEWALTLERVSHGVWEAQPCIRVLCVSRVRNFV